MTPLFETVSDEIHEMNDRVYRVIRLVLPVPPPDPPSNLHRQDLVDLARKTLFDPSVIPVDALLIFAYASGTRADSGVFTHQIMVSRDGRGWLGNGLCMDQKTKDRRGVVWFVPSFKESPIPFPASQSPVDPSASTILKKKYWADLVTRVALRSLEKKDPS